MFSQVAPMTIWSIPLNKRLDDVRSQVGGSSKEILSKLHEANHKQVRNHKDKHSWFVNAVSCALHDIVFLKVTKPNGWSSILQNGKRDKEL